MKRILIVDDEQNIREVLKEYLEFNGFEVITADDGYEAVDMCKREDYDFIVMDIMMPKMDGLSAVREIRKTKNIPVMVLSARGEEYDKLFGFEAGIDDYVTKPFSMPLVVKHIEAVLRRAEQGAGVETNILRYKDLTLDTDSFTVLVKDESVSLTIREFEILKLLVENQGRVFTRESLLDSIWGYDYFGDEKIVNTHIKNIRKKLGVDYIETIRGAGYKIEKEN